MVLLAAGESTRMGGARSKCLVPIDGQSPLVRVLEVFRDPQFSFNPIVVTVPSAHRGDFFRVLNDAPVEVVSGGRTRQESVFLALCHLREHHHFEGSRRVIIHDVARALITPEIVQRVVAAVGSHQALTTGIPCSDSVKEVNQNGVVVRSLKRDAVRLVQTPQAFAFTLLIQAHEVALKNGTESTDDAALVEQLSPVVMVEGSRENIKLTTPTDYRYAEAVFRERRSALGASSVATRL